ncbi:unnamed protein product [Paramecium sonneborni]|uniref:Uncharacterized protein n=1 Tax=Paramecium sonneborni TaxID=65129 RepID=A0A8S1RVT3_9CILI|nr:unnamed protein product [Paramecium sonneborni]
MVVGCSKQIKVFEFNQGVLNQYQLLTEHAHNVQTQNLMKKSNHLISGSLV